MTPSQATRRRAAVLTVSDGVSEGVRDDASGRAVTDLLVAAGYEVVATAVVPDEGPQIQRSLRHLADRATLVVTTGGTGFGPRDVTPEATRAIVTREAPGLGEAMRAAGRQTTPMADLSRGIAGTVGRSLVVNLPGSSRGAVESLQAVLAVLPHALDLLEGHTAHGPGDAAVPPHGAGPADGDLAGDPTAELARVLDAGGAAVLATAVRVHGEPPCRPGQKLLVGPGGPLAGTLGCAEFDAGAAADAREILTAAAPAVRTYEHDLGSVEVYLEPHGPRPLLVVLGATPVALWLLRWGRDLGFDTALVEPRPERITADHRDTAGRVVHSPEELPVGTRTDAVHTDHDAPHVAEHVAALLRRGSRFVGVMGSRRHATPQVDALAGMGLSPEELERVHTPVGLDIGARAPAEIALSILAGLVAARSGRDGGWLDRGRP